VRLSQAFASHNGHGEMLKKNKRPDGAGFKNMGILIG
jgi:hypothetical protein